MKIVTLLLATVLSLAVSACSAKPAPPARPGFEVVREIRGEIQKAADARQAETEREGKRVIWRSRLDACLDELDRLVAELEKHGAYGPPQDEQADELMRIGWELGQASECDARLFAALKPQANALMRASKQLRRFSVPEQS